MPRKPASSPVSPLTFEDQMLQVLLGQPSERLIALLSANPGSWSAAPQLRAASLIIKHHRGFDVRTIAAARSVLRRYDLNVERGSQLPNFMEEYATPKASGPLVDTTVLTYTLGGFSVTTIGHTAPQRRLRVTAIAS